MSGVNVLYVFKGERPNNDWAEIGQYLVFDEGVNAGDAVLAVNEFADGEDGYAEWQFDFDEESYVFTTKDGKYRVEVNYYDGNGPI